jgi:hypothetical protein
LKIIDPIKGPTVIASTKRETDETDLTIFTVLVSPL